VIVLDTHVLVWWLSGSEPLGKKAKAAIAREREEGEIVVSSISAWEVAQLVRRGRLSFSMDVSNWFSIVREIDSVKFMPVDNDIAIRSVELPGAFHSDPADRMIVATARKLGVPLVTKDEKIRDYPHVKTIW
jgi:PIN domain nuclease of toxin-antitoxin system